MTKEASTPHEKKDIATNTEDPSSYRYLHGFDSIEDDIIPYVGGKGANLVLMRRGGLPVPPGYCIPDKAFQYYLQNGKLPDSLLNEITQAKQKLGGRIAIRSSANCEDGTELSMAGVFSSHYVENDNEIEEAVLNIFNQAQSPEVANFMTLHGKSAIEVSMGLVIQELVEPETAGVIYSGVNGNQTLVQYVSGFGAQLVDGETQGSSFLLNNEGTIIQSAGFDIRPLAPNIVAQLSSLTQQVEDLFQGHPQDIEFVQRGDDVYIVQARPLTRELGQVELQSTIEDCLEMTKSQLRRLVAEEKKELGTYTAIFSDANYSELLPRPTEMDIGMYMYVWGGSDGIPGATQLGRAEMGYLVEDDAIGIIKYIGGRTYASIARYAGIYHIGFPSTREEYFQSLVSEYLTAVQNDPELGSYPQMGLFMQDPTFADLKQRYGDKAQEYYDVYQSFVKKLRSFADEFISEFYAVRLPETTEFVENQKRKDIEEMSNEELLNHSNTILEHIRTQSYVDFVKGARLGFYYSQRLQKMLQEKLGYSPDEAKSMYSRLNQGLDGSAITEANISIAQASTEDEALEIAFELIGHFSTGEMLEIRHPPLRDVPEALATYVRGIRQSGNYIEQFERQRSQRIQTQETLLNQLPEEEKEEFAQVVHASQTYMALRETAKYYFTKEYLLLHDAFEQIGKNLNLSEGDIYFVYPRELAKLIQQPDEMRHIIESRKQAFKLYPQLDLPNVIREEDIEKLSLNNESLADFEEATGKFLAEGPQVEGIVVNIDEFDDLGDLQLLLQQYKEEGSQIILVATQMNLTHDPFIAQSSGLIIQNAGIVAHGAQRARELGKGAIGGIPSRMLKTGTYISFDPVSRTIKKI